MSATHTDPVPTRRRVVDSAQYGLAAFLAVVGAVVVWDATTLEKGFADQPVQPYAMPYVVGAGLLLLAVLLAVATACGDVPEAEEGEDVDLSGGSDWVTVAKLTAVFVLNVALVEWLGWAITGAILFAGSAWALGSRSWVRDVAIGVALSLLTWYGFYVGLGIPIPAGVLDGVL
ncbi:tripartite tricarboxylate transporter TctB family protein [Aeromicrobium massiliense]|uniref:tripartite tricarboxylate transporter TctB family protein n=1 Tax=Aeromicrobium massiliense TaxID=1464554 RepID=UPI0002F452E3|nr:tripartite tricarboxylate transporter TctB family protein [Aeromicrobium massiliense]